MTIQMAVSGASVAAISNNEAITEITAQEAAFYQLNSGAMKASMEATVTQAAADEKSIIDGADAQKTQAICQMTGAGLGIVTTAGGSYGLFSSGSGTQATPVQINLEEENGIEMQPLKSVPTASTTIVGEGTGAPATGAPTGTPSASLTGGPENSGGTPAAVKTGNTLKLEEQTEQQNTNNKTAEDNRTSTAKFITENASSLGNFFNSGMTGLGQIISYDSLVDQGKQKQITDLEQGIAGILGNLVSSNSSMIGALEQSRQSTSQVMSALQQHQG